MTSEKDQARSDPPPESTPLGSEPVPSATEPAPPELVRRAREGDREALGRLVRRIHPLVHRWCLARTGDAVEADDLSQEVLVRVVQKLDGFRGEARFTSWLFRIVRNESVSRARRRAGREARQEALDGEAVAGAPPLEAGAADSRRDPEAAVDRERLMGRVEACYLSLPRRQREVFQLVELDGCPAVEVAERLELASSTVRVLLLRARRRIREEILRTDPDLAEAYLE